MILFAFCAAFMLRGTHMWYENKEDAPATTGADPTAMSHEEPRMGYRECSISGCPCQAFKDTYGSDLCSNCGHKFTDHW
jgi:hypothetical protein